MDTSASNLLGPDGPLAQQLPGFVARPAQQQMAQRIEQIIEEQGTLVVESGTGTGKTFAYLVPALLSGQKVIVSTGTKHLQDQLFERDLPTLCNALELSVDTAMLKGRANYLCLYRLHQNTNDVTLPGFALDHIETVRAWSARTRTGELSELSEVPEDAPVWPMVTSTSENCIGGKCDLYEKCFVNKARKQALNAQLVVINHHLFCADLALKETGFGSLLPGADVVIFDEAHQLPNVASMFLGTNISANQLRELARDVRLEEQEAGSGVSGLIPASEALEARVTEFRQVLGESGIKTEWQTHMDRSEVRDALGALINAIDQLSEPLKQAAVVTEGMSRCFERAHNFAERLSELQDARGDDTIRWVETTAKGMSLHQTPLHIGRVLAEYLTDLDKSWIFTSATLSVGGEDFRHYLDQVGLPEAQTQFYPSPFDFENQALLYVPQGLPDPRQREHTERLLEKILPVLAASGGRAFLLFTSHRALQIAHKHLQEHETQYNLLVQGSAPRARLLEQFRVEPRAVLLGTASFWEGVDVRGEALSLVVIDKLPFAAPDDPVLQARLRAIEEAGGNPFRDYQLPSAVLALKQGVGRLIRDTQDRGVLVLCDPRILEKSYGKVFLKSLPPIPLTRYLEEAVGFFQHTHSAGTGSA